MDQPPSYLVALAIYDKMYDIIYTDGAGTVNQEHGKLLSTDENGFVVIKSGNRHVLIPKDRVERMTEVKEE